MNPTFTPVRKSTSPAYVYAIPTPILISILFCILRKTIWKITKNTMIGSSDTAISLM